MPRKKPSQANAVPQGLPYGQGKAMADAQRAIPLPDNRKAASQAIGAGLTGGPPSGTSPVPDPGGGALDAAIAAALGGPTPGGGLAAPTERPDEALTAGSPLGPGPGPEALTAQQQQRGTVADYFAIAAQVFGDDPNFIRMAERARRRGL